MSNKDLERVTRTNSIPPDIWVKEKSARLRKSAGTQSFISAYSDASASASGDHALPTKLDLSDLTGPGGSQTSMDKEKKVSQCAADVICVKSIFWHPFSFLLIFMPMGIWAGLADWSAGYLFTLNFVALIPLAKILGDFTEELQAALSNEVISGLVSATLGNAVEMIVTIQMLRKGNVEIVKEALIGSVLSNMLLVLGTSFFCGGLSRVRGKRDFLKSVSEELRAPWLPQDKEQKFQNLGTLVSMTMLLVSCMSFALPTVFYYTTRSVPGHVTMMLRLSRICASIVFSSYLAYLLFALYTHKQILADDQEEEDDDDDRMTMSVWLIVVLISSVTLIITILSDFLCDSISGVTASSMTQSFVGVILLPFVGNACEHAAAVRFAIQDMPGLAVSIAVGSSTQIALFVVPFAVLAGWAIDVPMDLGFGAMNTIVMTLSVVIVLTVVTDGRANWLEGYMLVTAYAIIAVMYWFLPDMSDI